MIECVTHSHWEIRMAYLLWRRQLELEEIQRLKEEIRKIQEEARKLQEVNKHVEDVNRQIEQMNKEIKKLIQIMLSNGISLEFVSKSLSKSENEILDLLK